MTTNPELKLNKELDTLHQMIAFSNPIQQGHTTDWKSVAKSEIFREEETKTSELQDKEKLKSKQNIPRAKQSHMQGILTGIPTNKSNFCSTTQSHYSYDAEMQNMTKETNTDYFRKRDKHTEYLEARAKYRHT